MGLQTAYLTCVRDTALDRVVGMQQKTVSPKASSGGCNGSRSATKPASGVMSSIVIRPYSIEPLADRAWLVSPLFRFRPDMMKMPVVVKVCRPALAALMPGPGARNLKQWRQCMSWWNRHPYVMTCSSALAFRCCCLCRRAGAADLKTAKGFGFSRGW